MSDSNSNGYEAIIAHAIEEIKAEQGSCFSIDKINLAELERRTGVSRGRLRTLKAKGFVFSSTKQKAKESYALSGYTSYLESLLKIGISTSSLCFSRLKEVGYKGSQSTVQRYINSHKDLIPAKRQIVSPQGNRGRRYVTEPGEAYQMDWGFTWVVDHDGNRQQAACFAMICHSCGKQYIEFFPNAKQENLFIGMLHAFQYMGVPKYILTDNMKSVVIKRDIAGNPIWQKDYESFMKVVGFQTKLCKPYHPFTKGKVERLVRYVKENFLPGRKFWDVTDLNNAALQWCEDRNNSYHKAIGGVPNVLHDEKCTMETASVCLDEPKFLSYLCVERKISFDGFINYEGRRFGVPYTYAGKTARIKRDKYTITIYSADLKEILTLHDVNWSKRDRFCADQYVSLQPEELPTAAVKTTIQMLEEHSSSLSFEKFNFDKEGY